MDEAEWLKRTTDEDVEVRRDAALSDAERPITIWKIQATDEDEEVRRDVAGLNMERSVEIWRIQVADTDFEVRRRATLSSAKRPTEIWRIQTTDKNMAVRRNAAWSDAERPLEILEFQATNRSAKVRKAVVEIKGVEVVLFRGFGEKEWSYFTKKSQGKVAFSGRGLKTVQGIETKEGVLVIGDGGRVAALGKPGVATKLPDIRARYSKKASKVNRERVGTLLTRKKRFSLLKDDKGVLCWSREEGSERGTREVLLQAERLIKGGG